jgi:hypothetical protein
LKKNILIFGKSHHFISIIKKIYFKRKIYIQSWRKPKVYKKFDLIFVCGFDYSSLNKSYNYFIKKNYTNPFEYIKKLSKFDGKIVYINTYCENTQTYSRYNFVKNLLANKIKKSFPKVYIISIPTIRKNSEILIHGNFFSKFIFKILYKLGIINTITINNLKKILNEDSFIHQKKNNFQVKGVHMKFRRSLIVDRILRFLLG